MDTAKLAHPRRDDVSTTDFSFAFQPIVDSHARTVYSHEALVRGLHDEPAYQVINRSPGNQKQAFDAACRVKAIEVAARIGMHTHLNLNLLSCTALKVAVSLNSTVEAANRCSFPLERIIVELSINDYANFAQVFKEYRQLGLKFAIDDFGAGYSGLFLLSDFPPDIVKLDMELVRGIRSHTPRHGIVHTIAQACVDLGIDLVVEGVETVDEFNWFNDLGVQLYQGYLFAKPMFEAMPPFHSPDPN